MTTNSTRKGSKDMDGPGEPSVFVWSAAYFIPASKHWDHGELRVTPSTLSFYHVPHHPEPVSTPEKQAKQCLLKIRLDDITELKKANSSYVFKCIIIVTSDGDEHWVGSLPGRDGAYNALQHFWKDRLIGESPRKSSGHATKMGQELLSIAHDSKETLRNAGETLSKQGEQLDHARGVMSDLHHDLDIADSLTTHLESWFSHWGLSCPEMSSEPIVVVDAKGIPVIHEFPILYHEGSHRTHSHSLLTKVHLSPKRGPPIQESNGTLRLSTDGATVLDEEMKPVVHHKLHEISSIVVSSPWKLSIIKFCIGEPDVVYKITSTQMTSILKVLHSIACDKIQYESLVGEPVIPHFIQDLGPINITINQMLDVTQPSSHGSTLSHKESGSQQTSVQVHSEPVVVSDDEAVQLSTMISEMKSTAVGIQREQDRQMETIDALSDSVDNANIRLEKTTKRVAKLL